eukprot:6191764-Pleurochrysis_carterae.AAC.2
MASDDMLICGKVYSSLAHAHSLAIARVLSLSLSLPPSFPVSLPPSLSRARWHVAPVSPAQ